MRERLCALLLLLSPCVRVHALFSMLGQWWATCVWYVCASFAESQALCARVFLLPVCQAAPSLYLWVLIEIKSPSSILTSFSRTAGDDWIHFGKHRLSPLDVMKLVFFSNLFNNNLFIAPRYWPKYIVLKHNVCYVSSTLQLSNKNLKQTCWSLQTVSNFWR